MDELVWVQRGDAEPAWAAGGSYHVVRDHPHARRVLGPHRVAARRRRSSAASRTSGAPLDGVHETDVPDFAADPDGA